MWIDFWFDYKNFLNSMRPSGPQGPPGQGPPPGGYQPSNSTSDKFISLSKLSHI